MVEPFVVEEVAAEVGGGDPVTGGQIRLLVLERGAVPPEVVVKIGQPVRGGADIIARLGNPIHSVEKRLNDAEFEPIVPRETPA